MPTTEGSGHACCRPEALKCGIADLGALGAIMRFGSLANMAGIPAITIPAGHDTAGACPCGCCALTPPSTCHKQF